MAKPRSSKLKRVSKACDNLAMTRELAEEGSLGHQMELAEMYRDGIKIPKNDAEAFRWFLAAALQGETSAMYEIGNSYALGIGVAQDKNEALKWLYKLAYPETPNTGIGSQMLIAQLLMAGIYYWPGETHDLAKAYGWLLLAICYAQPWNVEETPFNRDILRGQQEMASKLEEAKAKFESEMTGDQRTRGQQIAAELFRPLPKDDDDE